MIGPFKEGPYNDGSGLDLNGFPDELDDSNPPKSGPSTGNLSGVRTPFVPHCFKEAEDTSGPEDIGGPEDREGSSANGPFSPNTGPVDDRF